MIVASLLSIIFIDCLVGKTSFLYFLCLKPTISFESIFNLTAFATRKTFFYHLTDNTSIVQLLSHAHGHKPVITGTRKLVNPDFPVVTTVCQRHVGHHIREDWTRQFGHE